MSNSKPIRILYMEDDIGLAKLFKRKLERNGYWVDLAHDGGAGLALYDRYEYDVIAVDHNMPVHDGLEVIRELAIQGELPPIIMITGSGNEKIAIEAMKLGASDYIVKDVEGRYLELMPSVVDQVYQKQQLIEEKQQAIASLQQLNRNLALLNLVSQQLTSMLDVEQIVDALLQAVTETIGAKGSSVWLLEDTPEPTIVCQAAFHQDRMRTPVNMRLRLGQGIAGWVVKHGETVVIARAPDDPRFAPEIDQETNFRTDSLMAVPLQLRGSIIGVLEVINKVQGKFNADDRAVVETLAASAAVAIDNARLVETLRQQTTELQARNEELDAFAHTVAHDLKTPLGPITGFSELLLKYRGSMSDKDIGETLHTISRSGRKMNNIVNELLMLATMRDAKIETEPLDMLNVVAEAQQRLTHLIEEKEATLIISPTWPQAVGYGPWIEEVWANYISNGLKYGGRPPHLTLGATAQPDGMVRFWIRDNGRGLQFEEQRQLFMPFTQLKQIRAQGHGLGLSIVRRIVEKLGGQVGVESSGIPGQGSSFYFTLPAAAHEQVYSEPMRQSLVMS